MMCCPPELRLTLQSPSAFRLMVLVYVGDHSPNPLFHRGSEWCQLIIPSEFIAGIHLRNTFPQSLGSPEVVCRERQNKMLGFFSLFS